MELPQACERQRRLSPGSNEAPFPFSPSQPGAWAASWFQASRLGLAIPLETELLFPACWKLSSPCSGDPEQRLRLDREALWSLGRGLQQVCVGREV